MNRIDIFYKRLIIFIFTISIISVIFGAIYYELYRRGIDDFKAGSNEDPFTFWYFSWTSQATVGFGDFTAKSTIGRFLVCVQSFIFWIAVFTLTVLANKDVVTSMDRGG